MPSQTPPTQDLHHVSQGDQIAVEESGLPTQEIYSTFPKVTKVYLTYFLGLVATLSTLTATIYFPLIPILSVRFKTSIEAINLTVTLYTVLQAISPAVFGSLADALGRRPVLLVLIALYAASSLGLALNKESYATLLVLRGVQSIGGSSTLSIAYGIVADLALPSERGGMLGPLLSTCNAISATGPVIGGAVAHSTDGSKWVFMALLFLALFCLITAGFTLPETARNVVGNGVHTPSGIWATWTQLINPRYHKCIKHPEKTSRSHVKWEFRRLLDALRIVFYPDSAVILLMIASSYSVYYTFQVAIPVIFDSIYNYNELEIGLSFLPGLVGMTLGGIIAGKLVDRYFRKTANEKGIDISNATNNLKEFPIEIARYRNFIPIIFLQSVLIAGYGWAVNWKAHPACLLSLQFFICTLSTMLSHPASALLVDVFPEKSSTAYSSGQIARCGMSAVCVAVVQPLIDRVGRGWTFTMFAIFVGFSGIMSVMVSRSKGMEWRQARI